MGYGGDQRSGRLFRRAWWCLAVGFAVAVLACELLAEGADPPALWLGSPFAFVWLSTAWRGSVPDLDARLLATGAAIVAVALVGHLVGGAPVAASVRAAVGVAAQASLTCLLYRSLRGWFARLGPSPAERPPARVGAWRREWMPVRTRDLTMLAVATTAAAVLVLPIGVHPFVWVGGAPTEVLLRSTAQSILTGFVGGACLLLVVRAPRQWRREPRIALVPLLLAASVTCAWVVLEGSRWPISWLLLLPSILAGSVLGPRAAALHSLGVSAAATLLASLPRYDATFPAPVPVELNMLALAGTSTLVALALAMLNAAHQNTLKQLDAKATALAQQTRLFDVVFNAMSDGLLLVDDRGGVTMSNAAARALLGKPVPRSRLSSWSEYFGLRHLDGTALRDVPGSPGHATGDATVAVGTPTGRRVLHVSARPVAGQGDNVSVVLFSDTTAEHERLSELTGFAGTVAHDLRAPLTGLEGWLELARDAIDEGRHEEAAQMLARTHLGVVRMRQVVQDWLDYAVGRDGELAPAPVRLQETVQQVVGTFVSSGREHEPQFLIDAPHVVRADPAMTRQVLANLVSNAVKYARPGEPAHVSVTSRPDERPGWVRVDVADRGRGIPAGEERRIFDEFHRAPNHYGAITGTGLGLALCRRIVTRHGGTIAAANNPEGGATVTFTLPAVDVADTGDSRDAPWPGSG